MIGALFQNYQYIYIDRTHGYPQLGGTARIDIELNAVASGEVEFVLAMPSWMKSRKKLIIHESPKVGQGAWTVSIDANSLSGRNGLYTYQLDGAYLEFKVDDGYDSLIDSWKTFVGGAPPGSRIHFNWISDTVNEIYANKSYGKRVFFSIAEYLSASAYDYQVLRESGVVPNDQVEFVLENRTPWLIDALINESPSVGTGMWTLSTQPNQQVDRNGLYMYQIRPGASLVIKSYIRDIYGRVSTKVEMIDIWDAIPGTRYTVQRNA